MHLLDITTAHASSQNHVFTLRAQPLLRNQFVFGNDKRGSFRWNCCQVPKMDTKRFEVKKRVFEIRAVASLEPKCPARISGRHLVNGNLELDVDVRSIARTQQDSLSEELEELDEKEKSRRMRISKANKGKTPWNKGRKHSPETLQRIRERTRIAMQSPKVKIKLVNLGHAQSRETRMKIAIGVRAGWERRRERLILQETCYFEWQNFIAEASRRGFAHEKELQWDSYMILDKELEEEWLASVEQRKKMPRPKGNKRAPKSPEQRRKISEAISAKWADAGYRDRVCSALSKYYGTAVGVERKPRRKPRGERQPKTQTPSRKKAKDTLENVKTSEDPRTKLRKSNIPLYKDPFSSSKLEMIKNIRAERGAAERKTEAIKQAKLLIWEAEKSAKALEACARRSPLAQASLVESRELIAKAIQSLNSIENNGRVVDFNENGKHSPSFAEEEVVSHTEGHGRVVYGFGKSSLMGGLFNNYINGNDEATAAANSTMSRFRVNGKPSYDVEEKELPVTQSGGNGSDDVNIGKTKAGESSSFTEQLHLQLAGLKGEGNSKELLHKGARVVDLSNEGKPNPVNSTVTTKKKWVRGRLVDVVVQEGD